MDYRYRCIGLTEKAEKTWTRIKCFYVICAKRVQATNIEHMYFKNQYGVLKSVVVFFKKPSVIKNNIVTAIVSMG